LSPVITIDVLVRDIIARRVVVEMSPSGTTSAWDIIVVDVVIAGNNIVARTIVDVGIFFFGAAFLPLSCPLRPKACSQYLYLSHL
jgi:hypothetical protein